jgi:hypothetical protein
MNKSKGLLTGIVILMLFTTFGASAPAAEVVQGTCLSVDNQAKTLTVQNEIDKTEVVLDLSHAKIGLKPEKGNIVRIAFRKEGNKNIALKVMNVTKQNLRKD